MTSADIITVLRRRYSQPKWLLIEELRIGSGWGAAERRIDLWCLDCAPSRGNTAIAYEVKVSRGDYLREVGNARKHAGARLYSNEFYFAAPAGMLNVSEIPDWAGLIEVDPAALAEPYYVGKQVIHALHREKARPAWPLIVSLLRRA